MRAPRIDRARNPSGGSTRPDLGPHHRDVASRVRQPTASSIVDLQRTVGNRVVRQLLLGGQSIVTAVPVVQRATYGLDKQKSQNTYVDEAVRLWQTQPGMALKDFADALLKVIALEEKGYGVPFFGWMFTSGAGAAGIFDSKAWKVQVNVSKFSSRTTAKNLKDLTEDEVTEVVGTLYHESRHADQDVLIIRTMLDQKKTPSQIHAATSIRQDVIRAVTATTYSDKLDADQIAHAGRMFDVMYGAHKELLEFLVHHSAAVEGLDILADPNSKLSASVAHMKTLQTWHAGVLAPKVRQMKARKGLTPVETALRQRLGDIDKSLASLLAAWKKVHGAKKPAQADVDDVRDLAGEVKEAIVEAYVRLEGEEDAFRVEREVTTAFSKKIANP